MKYFSILIFLVFISCSSLQYSSKKTEILPEIGTIGVYSDYLLDKNHLPKSVVSLDKPIRLKIEEIKVEKMEFFKGKGNIDSVQKDSSLVSIEVLDNIAFIKQLNADKELLKYLKKGENYSVVSKTKIHFPKTILDNIKSADEYYLVQNKEKTLSIELRKENKQIKVVEFSDGKITSIRVSEFCWGQNKKRKIEIFDIIPKGTSCNKNTYKSAQKAKKKNEFKF